MGKYLHKRGEKWNSHFLEALFSKKVVTEKGDTERIPRTSNKQRKLLLTLAKRIKIVAQLFQSKDYL